MQVHAYLRVGGGDGGVTAAPLLSLLYGAAAADPTPFALFLLPATKPIMS